MKSTIHRLATSVSDMARTIDDLAAGMPHDSGIRGAEAIIHLRNSANELNHAHNCMQMCLAQAADNQALGERPDRDNERQSRARTAQSGADERQPAPAKEKKK